MYNINISERGQICKTNPLTKYQRTAEFSHYKAVQKLELIHS